MSHRSAATALFLLSSLPLGLSAPQGLLPALAPIPVPIPVFPTDVNAVPIVPDVPSVPDAAGAVLPLIPDPTVETAVDDALLTTPAVDSVASAFLEAPALPEATALVDPLQPLTVAAPAAVDTAVAPLPELPPPLDDFDDNLPLISATPPDFDDDLPLISATPPDFDDDDLPLISSTPPDVNVLSPDFVAPVFNPAANNIPTTEPGLIDNIDDFQSPPFAPIDDNVLVDPIPLLQPPLVDPTIVDAPVNATPVDTNSTLQVIDLPPPVVDEALPTDVVEPFPINSTIVTPVPLPLPLPTNASVTDNLTSVPDVDVTAPLPIELPPPIPHMFLPTPLTLPPLAPPLPLAPVIAIPPVDPIPESSALPLTLPAIQPVPLPPTPPTDSVSLDSVSTITGSLISVIQTLLDVLTGGRSLPSVGTPVPLPSPISVEFPEVTPVPLPSPISVEFPLDTSIPSLPTDASDVLPSIAPEPLPVDTIPSVPEPLPVDTIPSVPEPLPVDTIPSVTEPLPIDTILSDPQALAGDTIPGVPEPLITDALPAVPTETPVEKRQLSNLPLDSILNIIQPVLDGINKLMASLSAAGVSTPAVPSEVPDILPIPALPVPVLPTDLVSDLPTVGDVSDLADALTDVPAVDVPFPTIPADAVPNLGDVFAIPGALPPVDLVAPEVPDIAVPTELVPSLADTVESVLPTDVLAPEIPSPALPTEAVPALDNLPVALPTELAAPALPEAALPTDAVTELAGFFPDIPTVSLPTDFPELALPTDFAAPGLPTDPLAAITALPEIGLPTDNPAVALPTEIPAVVLPTDLPTEAVPSIEGIVDGVSVVGLPTLPTEVPELDLGEPITDLAAPAVLNSTVPAIVSSVPLDVASPAEDVLASGLPAITDLNPPFLPEPVAPELPVPELPVPALPVPLTETPELPVPLPETSELPIPELPVPIPATPDVALPAPLDTSLPIPTAAITLPGPAPIVPGLPIPPVPAVLPIPPIVPGLPLPPVAPAVPAPLVPTPSVPGLIPGPLTFPQRPTQKRQGAAVEPADPAQILLDLKSLVEILYQLVESLPVPSATPLQSRAATVLDAQLIFELIQPLLRLLATISDSVPLSQGTVESINEPVDAILTGLQRRGVAIDAPLPPVSLPLTSDEAVSVLQPLVKLIASLVGSFATTNDPVRLLNLVLPLLENVNSLVVTLSSPAPVNLPLGLARRQVAAQIPVDPAVIPTIVTPLYKVINSLIAELPPLDTSAALSVIGPILESVSTLLDQLPGDVTAQIPAAFPLARRAIQEFAAQGSSVGESFLGFKGESKREKLNGLIRKSVNALANTESMSASTDIDSVSMENTLMNDFEKLDDSDKVVLLKFLALETARTNLAQRSLRFAKRSAQSVPLALPSIGSRPNAPVDISDILGEAGTLDPHNQLTPYENDDQPFADALPAGYEYIQRPGASLVDSKLAATLGKAGTLDPFGMLHPDLDVPYPDEIDHSLPGAPAVPFKPAFDSDFDGLYETLAAVKQHKGAKLAAAHFDPSTGRFVKSYSGPRNPLADAFGGGVA